MNRSNEQIKQSHFSPEVDAETQMEQSNTLGTTNKRRRNLRQRIDYDDDEEENHNSNYCDICKIGFPTDETFRNHREGQVHRMKVSSQKLSEAKKREAEKARQLQEAKTNNHMHTDQDAVPTKKAKFEDFDEGDGTGGNTQNGPIKTEHTGEADNEEVESQVEWKYDGTEEGMDEIQWQDEWTREDDGTEPSVNKKKKNSRGARSQSRSKGPSPSSDRKYPLDSNHPSRDYLEYPSDRRDFLPHNRHGHPSSPPPLDRRDYHPLDRREYPLAVDRRGYPAVPDRRDYPPSRDERDYPPHPDRRDFVPPRDERDYLLYRDRRGFPPRTDRRDFPPPRDERGYPPHQDRRIFPPPPDRRDFLPPLDRRDFPPIRDVREYPPSLDRRGLPPTYDRRDYPPVSDSRDIYPPPPRSRDYPPLPIDRQDLTLPRDVKSDIPHWSGRPHLDHPPIQDRFITDSIFGRAPLTTAPLPATDIKKDLFPDNKTQFPDNKWYCKVCQCAMTSVINYQAHIAGIKHAKNMRKHGLDVTKPLSEVQELIDEAKESSTPMESTEIAGFEMPTEARAQGMVDSYTDTPLIGLQHVTEYLSGSDGAKYVCSLCECMCDINALISHVAGLKHRTAYMKQNFMNYYTQLHQAKMSVGHNKSNTSDLILQYSQEIQELTGIEKIKVKIDQGKTNKDEVDKLLKLKEQLELTEKLKKKKKAKAALSGATRFTVDEALGKPPVEQSDTSIASAHGANETHGHKGAGQPGPSSDQQSTKSPPGGMDSNLAEMIKELASYLINDEEEAALAMQVTNNLTQALLRYRLGNHT